MNNVGAIVGVAANHFRSVTHTVVFIAGINALRREGKEDILTDFESALLDAWQ